MVKKPIPGLNPKERWRGHLANKMVSFMLADGAARGALIHGSYMVSDMRAGHELGILETYVLGQAYLAITLMSSDLKGADRIAMKINCDGPIKGWSVEASATGEVRGYLQQMPIPIAAPLQDFNLAPFYGSGQLTVIRYPEAAKQPYQGQVELVNGDLAGTLARYYQQSEQTPSAFHISIQFDAQGVVSGAGGVMVQMLPGFTPAVCVTLERHMLRLPSLGAELSAGVAAEEYIHTQFKDFSPVVTATRPVEFFCRCRKESLAGVLQQLPVQELEAILNQPEFPLQIRCHNCNSNYDFSRDEIDAIYKKRMN